MRIFRIALTEYCDTSGEGARVYGGRWNLRRLPALYGSGSVASCLLERLTIDSELFSSERYVFYSVMEFTVPDQLVVVPPISELPLDWDAIPPQRASQEFGTRMLSSGMLCFGVPSVVDPTSMNYVINPLSKDFPLLTYRVFPLELDKRILR
ncbi:hypothetical protein C943_01026 [Mariniradius saccharolyticus AK6]|uniref:RES domain-containing protein n=1 Tax=Mariniradius saccharolyticus AK6 TaxID=1239962 RepID=M7XDN8_9BACT|nr:RES family NAD+ phosphorylase [Mariniradius saccharolyticus]EMS32673.1 hypothetical protein C943_01026 [Mariniradius saccharolyticus AK6]